MMSEDHSQPRAAALEGPGAEQSGWRTRLRGAGWSTAVRLLILSLIVGLFLSFLGLDPVEFWRGAWRMASGLVSMLGDTAVEIIRNLATYLLFGAAIVVPVWIAYRILGGSRR
jgi:hypothetical protein